MYQPYLLTIHYTLYLIVRYFKAIFSYLLFPMESFASFLANVKMKVMILHVTSKFDFIGSYFYDQYSTNILRASCATFHQQHGIDTFLFEIHFCQKFSTKTRTCSIISLKSKIFNNEQLISSHQLNNQKLNSECMVPSLIPQRASNKTLRECRKRKGY